jgi:hypothetical protein
MAKAKDDAKTTKSNKSSIAEKTSKGISKLKRKATEHLTPKKKQKRTSNVNEASADAPPKVSESQASL